jgi:hypothetical protein
VDRLRRIGGPCSVTPGGAKVIQLGAESRDLALPVQRKLFENLDAALEFEGFWFFERNT